MMMEFCHVSFEDGAVYEINDVTIHVYPSVKVWNTFVANRTNRRLREAMRLPDGTALSPGKTKFILNFYNTLPQKFHDEPFWFFGKKFILVATSGEGWAQAEAME